MLPQASLSRALSTLLGYVFFLIGSCSFTIPRNATILADNEQHRVTIAAIHLMPEMLHYAVPGMSDSVFLQAQTKNTSEYLLLRSSQVAVFLDGNFVSNTIFKESVSPGESFTNFLGVDASIKMTTLPLKSNSMTKGYFSKTQRTRYERSFVIHNTKNGEAACRIIFADTLPLSSDEKIKVEMVEPSAEKVSQRPEYAEITSEEDVLGVLTGSELTGDDLVLQCKATNNVIWVKTVKGGSKVTVPFIYEVSWPEGSEVETNTVV